MDIDEIIELVGSWEDTVVLAPGPGSDAPEIAWGDVFFTYSPDADAATTNQPFATIVTKNYPDDETSRLDRPGVFRLSIAGRRMPDEGRSDGSGTAGTSTDDPDTDQPATDGDDLGELDRLRPHPVYGAMGWVAVLNPGPRTAETSRALLRQAYEAARGRYQRRRGTSSTPPPS